MNLAMLVHPGITRWDIWAAIVLVAVIAIAIRLSRIQFPDPVILQGYATISNTPGGIILILVSLWLITLAAMLAFCVWVILRGIDPTNGVVVLLTGMLSSTAFGAVNGALFSAMTGQPPPPVAKSSSDVNPPAPAPAPKV